MYSLMFPFPKLNFSEFCKAADIPEILYFPIALAGNRGIIPVIACVNVLFLFFLSLLGMAS